MDADMEEYLQSMRSLLSQMNEIEEESAKRTVEEQKQLTAIDAVEKDIAKVKCEKKRLEEETEKLQKARGDVCINITHKLHKVSALDIESNTLSQTLELLKQETVTMSKKLEERRCYYAEVLKDLSSKLNEQQEWFSSFKQKTTALPVSGNETSEKSELTGGKDALSVDENAHDLLEAKRAKLEAVTAEKSEVEKENNKAEEYLDHLKQRIDAAPPHLKEMDVKKLEEEHKALLASKAGEIEFLESLEGQIKQLKY